MPVSARQRKPEPLCLTSLDKRHRGVTRAIATSYSEAARVCLDRHHKSPTLFALRNDDVSRHVRLSWRRPAKRVKDAWANEIDATEAGAYCVVIAAAELDRGLVAVRRAETRTGADYYLTPPDAAADDLEACIRLEVSGLDKGTAGAVEYRLRLKLDQAAAGRSNLPALAGVVGFQAQLIVLQELKQ